LQEVTLLYSKTDCCAAIHFAVRQKGLLCGNSFCCTAKRIAVRQFTLLYAKRIAVQELILLYSKTDCCTGIDLQQNDLLCRN
jgi:hypothetical protein